MGFVKEFREFAVKGNVVDMAVGIIIGGAFGTIAKSLVEDVLMPPIGMLLGNVDFSAMFVVLKEGTKPAPYGTLQAAKDAGAVTLNYGSFINNVLSFLIVSLAVFFMIRGMNRLNRKEAESPAAPTSTLCPHCATEIPIAAKRCPHCTSDL
jgi:large conductance mechanosensitive channel